MDAISGDGDYTLADVMDDFIFLLVKRDAKLNEFDEIFEYMLGAEALNGALDVNVYNPIKRLTTNCDNYFGFSSVNEACIQQLCDKMYAYVVMSYDLGTRIKNGKLANYIGNYAKYTQAVQKLSTSQENGIENKFFGAFRGKELERRIDPKELKKKQTKLKKKSMDETKEEMMEKLDKCEYSFGVRFNYWQTEEDLIGIFK